MMRVPLLDGSAEQAFDPALRSHCVRQAVQGRSPSQTGSACRTQRHDRRLHAEQGSRPGITLLEVVIALAIFLGAVAVIGQLVNTGTQAAISAQRKAEAVRRCETVLAEALAGLIPLQSTSGAFEDDPAWTWNLTVSEGPHVDLLSIQAEAIHVDPRGVPDAEFTLVRWVRDPELFVESTGETGGMP